MKTVSTNLRPMSAAFESAMTFAPTHQTSIEQLYAAAGSTFNAAESARMVVSRGRDACELFAAMITYDAAHCPLSDSEVKTRKAAKSARDWNKGATAGNLRPVPSLTYLRWEMAYIRFSKALAGSAYAVTCKAGVYSLIDRKSAKVGGRAKGAAAKTASPKTAGPVTAKASAPSHAERDVKKLQAALAKAEHLIESLRAQLATQATEHSAAIAALSDSVLATENRALVKTVAKLNKQLDTVASERDSARHDASTARAELVTLQTTVDAELGSFVGAIVKPNAKRTPRTASAAN